jgi:VWFA-related protein
MAALLLALAVWSGAAVAQIAGAPDGQAGQQGETQSQKNEALASPEGSSPEKQAATPAPVVTPDARPQAAPANQPGDTVSLPAERQQRETNGSGTYVFRADVQEVILQATVVDEHQRPVTTLERSAFEVFEDGRPQSINSFRREDIPVALGIVIDNSGSMRSKRPSVNAAALNLVRASNPQDQVFVVNFNNDFYLDQDYTGNVSLLRDALERIEARGGTALYDAVVASSDHLMKNAKLQRKILLVVTDGEDTASRLTLTEAVRAIAVDGGPTVYAIGLLGEERERKTRRALRKLAEQSGGVAYFPANVDAVEAISQQIAHDIRNQYAIGYKPLTPKVEGGYRQVQVKASARGYKGLTVRTRSGYYASSGKASPSGN